jgi:hypothetical protein
VAVEVVADQVPTAAQRDEAVRLHVPRGRLAVRRRVAEAQPLGVPAGDRDARENAGVDAHPGAAPARRHGHRAQRLDPAAQPGRHHLGHLRQRPHRRLGDPLHGALRRRLQPDRERHRLLIVNQQGRQRRPCRQLVAARYAALRLDGVAELPEPVDIPPQRALGDLQPAGQLRTRPVPVRLQQRQQPQHA